MGRFEEIAKRALAKALAKGKPTTSLSESRIVYEEGHDEKMNSTLVKQLRDRNHTLGSHPIFPDSDESHFEEKLMSKRFSNVLKNYKRQFDSESADPMDAITNMMPIISDCMKLEDSNKEDTPIPAAAVPALRLVINPIGINAAAEPTPDIKFSTKVGSSIL